MSQLRIKKNSVRKSFGKIRDTIAVPNLIAIQSLSFNDFIQLDFLPDERRSIGLHKVLQGIFPIAYNDKMSLEYVSYELGNWACTCGKLSGIDNRYQWSCSACKKSGLSRLNQNWQCPYCKKDTAQYKACSSCLSRVVVKLPMSFDECRENGQTFSMPLRIKIQLVSWVGQEEDRVIHDIKEQDIFFADVPVMVDLYEEDGRFKLGSSGTFLINGVDRVIVSQLHRSPGVVFSQSKRSKDFRGQPYLLARIIPMRGSWIDFEFDSSGCLYVRIDKKKKFLFTAFLQALGFSRDSIISLFYDCESIYVEKGVYFKKVDDGLIGFRIEKGALPARLEEKYLGKRVTRDIVDVLKK